jgi:hypothetical protein
MYMNFLYCRQDSDEDRIPGITVERHFLVTHQKNGKLEEQLIYHWETSLLQRLEVVYQQ